LVEVDLQENLEAVEAAAVKSRRKLLKLVVLKS
jgi:hypothetical protein